MADMSILVRVLSRILILGGEVVRFKVEARQLQGVVHEGDVPPPARSAEAKAYLD